MSGIEYHPSERFSLESLPLRDMSADPSDPIALMRNADLGAFFLRDLRRDPGTRGAVDGFVAANGIPTEERTWRQLDADWEIAKRNGEDPESFYAKNVDTSRAALPVRDAHPGEPIEKYMDYVAGDVLRRRTNHPAYLPLPNPTDSPGTRFIGAFPDDSDIVAMGKIFRGDVEGGRDTIDNSIHLINKLNGLLPNFNGYDSLGRGHSPTLSYALECLATTYGEDGDEVIAHYREPLAKNVAFWMRGRSHLEGIRHGRGEVYGRQMLLPGASHDIVFRFYSDTPVDLATFQGLRRESAAEDEELALRILHGLTGEVRARRYERLVRDIEGACESTQDFADWEFEDYKKLETIRTSEIAPVYLQANMVHAMRMAGYIQEADKLSKVIMRRFFRRVDDTHAQFVDLDRDGKPTKALYAAQVYPLLVGGIVPYEAALLLANTWRDALLRPHGVLVSAGNADAQWSGSPSPTDDKAKDGLVRRVQENMYGRSMLEGEGDDRSWPSVAMLVSESFTMAAIEAQLQGKDPGPLWEVAELARVGTLSGIEARYYADHYLAEKNSAMEPTKFVDGGEYARTPEMVQKGFGMTIGAHRSLSGRNLRAEIRWPHDYSWRQWTLRHALGKIPLSRTIMPMSG
jgi:hypothetical protein